MSAIHTLEIPATPLDQDALRILADDNPAGMLVHRHFAPLYVNAAWAQTLGYTADEVMAMKSILPLAAPDERERLLNYDAGRLAGGDTPSRYTFLARHRDGADLWIEALVRPINWKDNPAILSTTIKVDVERDPARIEAMERVFRDHHLYLAVLSQVQDRISVIDSDYRYRFTNQRNLEFYGLTPARMIGTHVVEIIGEQRFARARPNYERVLRGGAVNYVHDQVCRDGSHGWVDVSMRPFRPDGDRIEGIVVTLRDITDLHHAGEAQAASERQLQSLLEHAPAMMFLKDAEGRFQVASRAFLDRYGLRREDVLGHTVHELFPAADAEGFAAHDERVMRERKPSEREIAVPSEAGPQLFNALKFPVLDSSGAVIGVGGVELDVSQSRRAVTALEESERRLSMLMSNLPGMAYRSRSAGQNRCTEFVSEGCKALTGYEPHEAQFFPQGFLKAITHPDDIARNDEIIARATRDGSSFQLRYRIRHRDGRTHWVWEQGRATVVGDDDYVLEGFVSDISESHELSQKLQHQARHDSLTDLLNRRAFEELLEEVVARTRNGSGEAALMYLDLDRFKVVNDSCGHTAGDELLRQITARMRDTVRQRDVLARLGGDEFALLLEHCPIERALEVAEKLRAAIQDFRFVWQEQAFSVGASIGLVPISEHSPSASALLVQADNACYAAKDSGRDQVHVFRDDDEQVGALSGQTRWLARIEGALISSELVLHVDPVVPAGDPEQGADHYQVLLRLPDEDGELVAAASFMRAAERYGLASRIDRWLVTQVLERLADSSARHRLSVGVSARSITDPDFPSFIRRQLARTGVSGDQLGFQITETLAITILSTASAFIDELHTDGCHFCLADFGSGLSSFSYLKSLPVDYVKVDGSFVRQISDDPTDRAMVRSIADIGRVLGKRTIAESVDDRTVLARVREAGVDLVQGKVAGPTRDLRLLD